LTDEAKLHAEYLRGHRKGVASEKESAMLIESGAKRELEQLSKKVREFEKASGVRFSEGWRDQKQIGDAVYRVLHGLDGRIKQQLEAMHGQALSIATAIENELAKDNGHPDCAR
jgi:hypothetical protein